MKKGIGTAIRGRIVFVLFVWLFPPAAGICAHLINPKIVLGNGGYSMERHYLGRDVLLEANGLYKSIDVEEFVVGVMAGVVATDYNVEALKTQAVLVRTNVLKEMEEKSTKDVSDLSYRYLTKEERKELWGRQNYEKNELRLEHAVIDTAGKVIRKDGELIMALYHEVSIGKTADASEIMDEDISYLKSVDSSRDVEARNYMNIYRYTWGELGKMLSDFTGENTDAISSLSIEESTENGFVKKVSIGEKIYTGQETADIFGLPSTNFYVENMEDGIRFVCLGKGNCLGVSQYGANILADKGEKMEDIILHYYGDVSLENYIHN